MSKSVKKNTSTVSTAAAPKTGAAAETAANKKIKQLETRVAVLESWASRVVETIPSVPRHDQE